METFKTFKDGKILSKVLAAGVVVMGALSCASTSGPVLAEASGTSSAPKAVAAPVATAVLAPLGGSTAHGTVTLTEMADGGVRIEGKILGLASEGLHGFHAHEIGDCSSPDGTSAGGHFNPTNKEHGDPAIDDSHVGDFGNIQADGQGIAEVFVVKKNATLHSGTNSLVGRSLIVHKGRDDLKTQPAGGSGNRVACGVIRLQGN